MPDDDKRRRLGDETKNRIDNLSGGWSLDSKEDAKPPEPLAAAPAPRKKHKTLPPPPPGSEARRQLEQAIVESNTPTPLPRLDLGDKSAKVAAPVVPEPSGPKADAPRAALPLPRHKQTAPPVGNKSGSVTAIPPDAPVGNKSGAVAAIPPDAPVRNKSGSVAAIPPDAPVRNKSGSVAAIPPAPPPRSKTSSMPPPIPGAAGAGIAAIANEPATTPDPKIAERLPLPPDGPPPIPAAALRSQTPSQPPPPRPASPSQPPPPRPASPSQPPPIPQRASTDDAGTIPEVPPAPKEPKLAVPIGEFEPIALDEQKLALSQRTVVRDAAEALLGIPVDTDPMTARFERGDPTIGERPDATIASLPGHRAPSGGTLRPAAALRRQRGIAGDVRYVSTALLGMRQSRKELAELEKRQELRQQSRKRHLVTLGRTAVISEDFDHPAVAKAREDLATVEEERSQHAGAVAAADAELERVRRDRDTKAKQYVVDLTTVEAELAALDKKLDPLLKEQSQAKKKASELRDQIRRIEKQIADTQASLHSIKKVDQDRAAILAEIASHKADLKAVQGDEPKLAAELDALNPRIAGIEAAKGEAEKRRAALHKAEQDDQKRALELLEAIGAKRKVVDRAAADAEAARDRVLFELGERLYVDRPQVLSAQLSPIDQIDLELGESDRRVMELREILSNIDKAKLFRGAAVLTLVVAAVGAFVAWLVYMLA